MSVSFPKVLLGDQIEKALDLLIDHTFLCVVDEEDYFEGIFTRRALLKELKKNMHKFNRM